MAIVFSCECGKELRSRDDFAGKRTKCPSCGAAIMIPSPKGAEPAKAEVKAAPPDPMADAIPVDFAMPSTPVAAHAATTPEPPSSLGNIKLDAAVAGYTAVSAVPDVGVGNHAYKVLMPKDYLLSTKFNAEGLEKVLNDYARQGWVVKATAVMSVPSASGPHDELILIMEH